MIPDACSGMSPSRRPPARPEPADDPYQLPDHAHDPGHEAARRREARLPDELLERVAHPFRLGAAEVRVGTASWTDPTLVESGTFYPADATTPEARLRHYASRFPLVEVDSSYYALPTPQMARAWVERTPADFVFDVKAHAFMTGQPSETKRLPKDIRAALPPELAAKPRLYGEQLPDELLFEVWARFLEALEPLRLAGKLGSVLLQFPRWVVPSKKAAKLIEDARRRLGDDVRGAVELRNHRWFESPERTRRVLDFLRDNELAFVMVDGPRGLDSSVPPVAAATSTDLAIVRLHGRRSDLWEKRGVPTVERYRYLYDRDQLEDWVEPIAEVAQQTQRVHVLMNNCHGNYGTTNAAEMGGMLVGKA